MKVVSGAIVMILLVAAVGHAQKGSTETERTVTVSRGGRLSLENVAGRVNVDTWDSDTVRVRARHSPRARVDIQERSDGVSIDASGQIGPGNPVDYDITAPRWMALKIEGNYGDVSIDGTAGEVSVETVQGNVTIHGGTGFVKAESVQGRVVVAGADGQIKLSSVNEGIQVENSRGDLAVETTNGGIVLTRVQSRSVDAETVNGDIQYEGSVEDGGQYSFTTHNGDITVGLPETSNVAVTVRTYNGSFRSDVAVKGSSAIGRGRRVTFTLGSGAAQMELESFGGTIHLRRAGTRPPAKHRE